MRSKQIETNKFNITLMDDASSTSWGWDEVVSIVDESAKVLEKFLYSTDTVLDQEIHESISIDIQFCDDEKMRSINLEHRQKDKTTDVLSFPMYESLRIGSDDFIFPGPVGIGDIIISRNVAIQQAEEFKLTVEQEVIHLIVHGFLHLLGWDHEISNEEEIEMENFEKKILKEIEEVRKACQK